VGEIRGLIRKQIVRDGMIPKLRSCARTLRHNVGEIDILSPAAKNGLVRAIASKGPVGTRIVK
jgi:acetylglutamate kinase